MKIRDIVRLADTMLSTNIDENLFNKESMDRHLADNLKSNKALISLVKCANLVINELACDYLPLTTTQKIRPVFGKADYGCFDKELNQIISAKLGGNNVKYVYRPSGVEFDTDGEISVEYSYRPPQFEYLDTAILGSSQVSERVLAYGVCAEYCLLSGMYEEAQIWDKRYKDNLMSCLNKKSELSVKARRWC